MQIIEKNSIFYPEKLKKIKNPPQKLYVEGNKELLNKKSLAIVGTRHPTEYGKKVAFNFAKELSEKGVCIVSGLASGIDTFAHLGAKSGKGSTIAVLGSGFNYIYPEHNLKLYNDILKEGGCVITEYEPDEKCKAEYFPVRNRIISGISMGVLIVEGKYRSGSGITARFAEEQDKEIFCIPGDIDSNASYLPNEYIRRGANLVTSVEDILEFYPETQEKNIDEDFLEIYKLMSEIPINADEIASNTNLSLASINEKLMMMEIEGIIKNVVGGYVIVNNN